MRAVLTIAVLAAVGLIGTGSAGAASGAPKKPLAAYGYHLYGEYCLSCHGPNAAGRMKQTSATIGAGPGRTQKQQYGVGPSLQGVGALAADVLQENGLLVRAMGDAIAFCPPLIISEDEINEMFDMARKGLRMLEERVLKENLRN